MTPDTDDNISSQAPPKVDLVLCVDPLSLERFRAALRHLCVGLLDAAAQVRVVTSSPEVESLMLGSIQHVFYEESFWPFRRQRLGRLLSALAGRPPNIVHGVSGRSFELADAAARRFDAHLILHAVELEDVESLAGGTEHPIDHVVAASQPIFDAILECDAVSRDRVTLIRPGLLAGDGPTCFTLTQRIPTILCTSQLTPAGGVDRLLEALRLLHDRGHEFMAFLTGSGPMEPALRKTVQAVGLASVVTFAEPLGDTKQIMTGSDIFVRPAIERFLSMRALQALGAGMALVTVQGGADDDAHVHEVTGLVCPDQRSVSLASAIERLLGDQDFACTLATQAVQYVKKNHSVSATCEALMHTYYELSLRDKTLSVEG